MAVGEPLPPIAPAGNELPRVLQELKRHARGGGPVQVPADLAAHMIDAIEAGIALGALLQSAQELNVPVWPRHLRMPEGALQRFGRSVAAIRNRPWR